MTKLQDLYSEFSYVNTLYNQEVKKRDDAEKIIRLMKRVVQIEEAIELLENIPNQRRKNEA